MWWWRQEFRGEPNPFVSQQLCAESTHNDMLTEESGAEFIFSELMTMDQHYFGMYPEFRDGYSLPQA